MKTKLTLLTFFYFLLSTSLFANDNIPKKSLKDYAGRYILPENQYAERVVVEIKNDTLLVVTDMGPIQLIQVSDDIFEVTEFNVLVKFIRDATKRMVLGVRIIYKEGDVDIFGKKETD